MEQKVKNFMDGLDYDELYRLKLDLDKGGLQLMRIVREKIAQKQKEHGSLCATCQRDINSHDNSTFTLLFGPSDLRQKASFCAVDCLEYFINRTK
jgi:hypothetical protein